MTRGAEWSAPHLYREMTLDDVAAGHVLSRASGWNQRADDWRLLLSRNPGRFVAAVAPDGRIAGTAGASCYGRDLAWVCMVLVEEAARGQGVGTRLMAEVLDRLGDMARVGLDATPLGRPVYARLGFAEAGTFLRMGADVGAEPADPGPARSLAPGDLPAVLAQDREAFGADRGDVLRWAAGQAAAWCVDGPAAIAGYCFGRRGEHSHHVGPVVARDVATARHLLARAMRGAPGRVIVDVAAERADWMAAVGALGFREQRPLVRMYRGGGPVPGQPDRQFALFGPEFG
jgi:GNAT superfamily N-acetyltransferase